MLVLSSTFCSLVFSNKGRSLLAIYKARATVLLPLESTIKEKLDWNWRKNWAATLDDWRSYHEQVAFPENADIPKNLFKASLYWHTTQTTQHDLKVTSADATDNVSTPRDHHMMVIWFFLPEPPPRHLKLGTNKKKKTLKTFSDGFSSRSPGFWFFWLVFLVFLPDCHFKSEPSPHFCPKKC